MSTLNFKDYQNMSSEEKHKTFFNTLTESNITMEEVVNWDVINDEMQQLEGSIKKLSELSNYSEDDFNHKIAEFSKSNPEIIKFLPSLVALPINKSSKKGNYFLDPSKPSIEVKNINFNKIDTNNISQYIEFINRTQLRDLLIHNKINSLSDFILGLKVGNDTNKRKNRSGKKLNQYVLQVVQEIINKNPIIYMEERSNKASEPIKIINKKTNKNFLIKTNFYNSDGSKINTLKERYIRKYSNNVNKEFIWITDGYGWEKSTIGSESFDYIPNIFNLKMLEHDFLEDCLLS